MAQTIEFQGFTFKINPENRKELLVKKADARLFTSFRNFEVVLHYLLCSKNQMVVSTESGFYNTLNPLSGDWLNFKI